MSPTSYTLIRGRPSQRSQESPNSPQPVRLECRNQRASRWCRQSAALKPAGSASGCVACQRTIRNVCSVWSCSPRNTFMASSKTFLPPDGSHVPIRMSPVVRRRTGPVESRRRSTVSKRPIANGWAPPVCEPKLFRPPAASSRRYLTDRVFEATGGVPTAHASGNSRALGHHHRHSERADANSNARADTLPARTEGRWHIR